MTHLTIAFQPVFDLAAERRIGYEALLRGPGGRSLKVLSWFDRAFREGWLPDLAHRAWALAAEHAPAVLKPSEFLFVNWDQRVPPPAHLPWPHTVIELSERHPLPPAVVAAFRRLGARVAMDDFGQGVTSLRDLHPPGVDVVKLDLGVIRGIDQDPARQVLLRGLSDLLHALAPTVWVLAEGIETEAERRTLVQCGIALGQGFWLGPPELAPAFRAPPDSVPVSGRCHR
ncbi:MAG: EAL domain-containing protein [Firmicutes bacterium]|nr:EAL domain-containing protein [Alicyclobacillaceae bacterium]MCL6497406.1 EAL domain-containing protein [Bacillota bacterium]